MGYIFGRKENHKILRHGIVLAVGLCVWLAPIPKFYSEGKIVELIREYENDLEVNVEDVLAVYEIDDTHRYVPFQIKSGVQGMSFWEYRYVRWELIQLEIGSEMILWNLEPGDFSKSYYLWNIRGENMEKLQLQVEKRRLFQVANYKQQYFPEMKFTQTIVLNDSLDYGYQKMPDEWGAAISPKLAMDTSGFFSYSQSTTEYPSFYYEVLNENDEVVQTEQMDGSYGFSSSIGQSSFDYVTAPIQEEDDMEQ